jgi:hypothetical protein
MNDILGGEALKLAGQGTHVVLEALLHVIHLVHNRVTNIYLDVITKFTKLKGHAIELFINSPKFGVHLIELPIHIIL